MRQKTVIQVLMLLAAAFALFVFAQTAVAAEQKVQFKVPGVV